MADSSHYKLWISDGNVGGLEVSRDAEVAQDLWRLLAEMWEPRHMAGDKAFSGRFALWRAKNGSMTLTVYPERHDKADAS